MGPRWRRLVVRGLMGLILLGTATSPAFVCDFEDGYLSFLRAPGSIDDDDWDDDCCGGWYSDWYFFD